MSPLIHILLKLLRGGAFAAAGFVGCVLGLEVWRHGGDVMALNPRFTLLLAVMLAGALWLARSIGRELARNGS